MSAILRCALCLPALVAAPAVADIRVSYVDSSPDIITIENRSGCALGPFEFAIDLGRSAAGLIFDTSGAGAVGRSQLDQRVPLLAAALGTLGAGMGGAVAGPIGLLVAIVGGLVGAGIGYMAEKQMKDRDGIEYVLEMDDGRLVTLVQNRESDVDPDSAGTAPVPSAGPGAAEPGGRNLLFKGGDVVEQPGKPAPPLTSTTGSGQQQ